MKLLFISRNIPVPGIKENDIILRIVNSLEDYDKTIKVDVLYPREKIVKIPFINFSSRVKAIYNLKNTFVSVNKSISSLFYLRLPTLKYSYLLLNTFLFINKKLIYNLYNKYDVIHAHNILPDGFIGLKLKAKLNIPFVVTIRNGDIDKINKINKNTSLYKMYMKVLYEADEIIAHNSASVNFINNLGLTSTSIPHGIEEKYLLDKVIIKENILLFVGNMIARKHLDWVIKAFENTKKINWKLVVIGDGEEFEKYNNQAENNKNINFLGRLTRNEIIEYMQKSKIFIMPSERETFGIVYLEAAASRCLVIGKKDTGIYGWLKDEEEALFVRDSNDLTNVLPRILTNELEIKRISNNGFNKVKTSLLWNTQIIKYIDLYKHLIGDEI